VLARLLSDATPDVLAYTAFPPVHWSKIWSNNPLSVNRPWGSVTGGGSTGRTGGGWILASAGEGQTDDGAVGGSVGRQVAARRSVA
jgi:hypothetical protein